MWRVPRVVGMMVPRGVTLQRKGLSTQCLETVKATLPAVAAAGPAFTAHFYKRMFAAHPELLNTFNVTNQKLGRQQKALFSAIAASAVNVLDHGTLPLELIEGVNHKHCALQVVPAQYDVVGEHILGTITDLLNPGQEVLDAWGELYGALAGHCVKREEEIYKEVESLTGGWRGKRSFVLTEKEVKSQSITRFTFAPADGKPVCTYSPGQYTTVWLQPESWENCQPRHYSLVTEPDGASYTIAVKREDQGLMSSYLHDHAAVGDKMELSPPYGNFNIRGVEELWTMEQNAPVVLLSAGVGITPMLSMLGHLKNGVAAHERPVVWLHGAKNGREHAFRDYIVGLARAHPEDLTRRVWYSDASADDIRGSDNKAVYHFDGRMNLTDVKDYLHLANPSTQYFFCGGVPWMRSVAHQLVDLGVDKSALHFEAFGPAEDILPQ